MMCFKFELFKIASLSKYDFERFSVTVKEYINT